ncbi:recombinase family protein [Vibrio parahaemolyticus]|uniref:recombinase family protein n=1 Tax=Vibrio parahaemolyticus TaxID=670 RepID=UPI0011105208|nr:recombinase family protein [Vibrio parahaemolyticus]TMX40199.1 recombinase family protein [Vibrio parahaemolyticus]TMX79260.1 recombinase family protein [Vibrio parahaemolyticus]
MNKENRRKAITYQRFSSVRQIGNSSLARQLDSTKEWLSRNPDVEVIDNYVDQAMSGWSGKHLKDGSLGQLMNAIEDGIVKSGTLILVEHFSRLTRQNLRDAEKLMHRIWDAGITVVTVRDGTEYSPSAANDMSLRIRLIVEMEQAFKESEWRSAKVKASYVSREKAAREGKVPKIRKPFWLNDDGTLNHLHQSVKDMFEWYRNGWGQQRIVVALREKYADEAIQQINPSTVMRWIKSDIVLGYWRKNRVYEAAVDETLYYEVQAIHKNRLYKNVNPDRQWPLSGLMKCGVCGRGMSIQKSGKSAPVIRCSSKQRDKSCNRKTTFPYYLAHIYMMDVVLPFAQRKYTNLNSNKSLQKELLKVEDSLAKENSAMSDLKETIKILKEQNKKTNFLLMEMQDVFERIEELETKQQDIRSSLEELSSGGISLEAKEIAYDKDNFNIEMHKLNFRIVIGEWDISLEGLTDDAVTLKYNGYNRGTFCYEYKYSDQEEMQSVKSSRAKTSTLMLSNLAIKENENWARFFDEEKRKEDTAKTFENIAKKNNWIY